MISAARIDKSTGLIVPWSRVRVEEDHRGLESIELADDDDPVRRIDELPKF
jgi:hypothetical protein